MQPVGTAPRASRIREDIEVEGIVALAQAQDRQVEAARATLARLATDGTSALAEAYLALRPER